MTKKKIQLKELKVKSFITIVDKSEQRTSKGGIVNFQTQTYILHDVGGNIPWTGIKTRVDGAQDDVLHQHILGNDGNTKR